MTERTYRVEWTEVARHDLIQIVDDLSELTPAVPYALLDHLEEKAATLQAHPNRSRLFCRSRRKPLNE